MFSKIGVEFRKAKPQDLKADRANLKVGQTFAVSTDEGKTIKGIFALHGKEDTFILKSYLDSGSLWIPLNDPNFEDFIKE